MSRARLAGGRPGGGDACCESPYLEVLKDVRVARPRGPEGGLVDTIFLKGAGPAPLGLALAEEPLEETEVPAGCSLNAGLLAPRGFRILGSREKVQGRIEGIRARIISTRSHAKLSRERPYLEDLDHWEVVSSCSRRHRLFAEDGGVGQNRAVLAHGLAYAVDVRELGLQGEDQVPDHWRGSLTA